MNKYVNLLKTWDGEFEDLSFALYDMLKEEKETDKIQCFQLICENIRNIDSDKSRKLESSFVEGEIEKLKNLYGKYIDEVINSIRNKVIYQNLTVDEFYSLLWNMTFENAILTSDKEKAFALFWVLLDDGIPYYELGKPLSMDNDEYKEIFENNRKTIDRIRYILSYPFEQKTEIASLILQEIASKEYKVQAVLMSYALTIYSKKEIDI